MKLIMRLIQFISAVRRGPVSSLDPNRPTDILMATMSLHRRRTIAEPITRPH